MHRLFNLKKLPASPILKRKNSPSDAISNLTTLDLITKAAVIIAIEEWREEKKYAKLIEHEVERIKLEHAQIDQQIEQADIDQIEAAKAYEVAINKLSEIKKQIQASRDKIDSIKQKLISEDHESQHTIACQQDLLTTERTFTELHAQIQGYRQQANNMLSKLNDADDQKNQAVNKLNEMEDKLSIILKLEHAKRELKDQQEKLSAANKANKNVEEIKRKVSLARKHLEAMQRIFDNRQALFVPYRKVNDLNHAVLAVLKNGGADMQPCDEQDQVLKWLDAALAEYLDSITLKIMHYITEPLQAADSPSKLSFFICNSLTTLDVTMGLLKQIHDLFAERLSIRVAIQVSDGCIEVAANHITSQVMTHLCNNMLLALAANESKTNLSLEELTSLNENLTQDNLFKENKSMQELSAKVTEKLQSMEMITASTLKPRKCSRDH